MIADMVLEKLPELNRRGFFVGNIAPDCNVENEGRTVFAPPREVTRWMQGRRKRHRTVMFFGKAYLLGFETPNAADEKYAFLLGCYLPHGCIVRKIGVMRYLPEADNGAKLIAISRREYDDFVNDTVQLVLGKVFEKQLL